MHHAWTTNKGQIAGLHHAFRAHAKGALQRVVLKTLMLWRKERVQLTSVDMKLTSFCIVLMNESPGRVPAVSRRVGYACHGIYPGWCRIPSR